MYNTKASELIKAHKYCTIPRLRKSKENSFDLIFKLQQIQQFKFSDTGPNDSVDLPYTIILCPNVKKY